MANKILEFIKREKVLVIAFIAAALSCLFVALDKQYIKYIDFRTLALLYCLMVVVAGLNKAEFFSSFAKTLLKKASNVRMLGLLLVILCFFTSMLITNDVALITFVPFAVLLLTMAGAKKQLISVVIFQTIAANLGSMLTPVGNPQNLYLYSYFNLDFIDFIKITLPIWSMSLVAVILLCFTLPKNKINVKIDESKGFNKKYFAIYCVLFLVCLAVVLRVFEWYYMLLVIIVTLLIFDRKTLLKCDFMLLLTFVCFFVFSGNLARIEQVNNFLNTIMNGREFLVSALASQVISNVPAAVLLANFTQNSRALLLGVNIGGLGTPVASLASLISYKLYMSSEDAKGSKYMTKFLLVNFLLLTILSVFVLIK